MKKICLFIILNLLFLLPCFAIEEETTAYKIFGKPKEVKFENGFINEISGNVKFHGTLDFDDYSNNKNMTFPFFIDAALDSKFGDNKYHFYTNYSFTRDIENVENQFFSKFTNLYLERNLNENNKLRFGVRRAPIGVEGSKSIYDEPFIRRAQISRTIGNAITTGVSLIGEKEFLEYDLGGYTTTRYAQGFKDGAEFIGRIGVKPFYKKDNSIKNLKFNFGTDIGHKHKDYEVYFAALDYEYKKFLFNAEYNYANGYNGRYYSTNEAQGFFVTGGVNLTPKLQFLVRYDYFDPNMDKKKNTRTEYSAGFNYFLFKERLRFALNYVFSNDRQSSRDGHGVYFLTQFFI